ncbi:unnamed protein product [Diamesa serratosioi]
MNLIKVLVSCLFVSVVFGKALSSGNDGSQVLAENSTVQFMDFDELEKRILSTEKVLVLQTYLTDLKDLKSEFENVSRMYKDTVEFVKMHALMVNPAVLIERNWNITGLTGKVTVFDNKITVNSTEKITTKDIFKIVNDGFVINVNRRLGYK